MQYQRCNNNTCRCHCFHLTMDSHPQQPPKPAPKVGKSGKKICCSCPETRKKRDECVVRLGEDKCSELIAAHNACLREEGFDV